MPVYNGEKYLAEAIESILNQTYDNFELILTDDVSVDHSIDICMYYLKLDNRIRVLKNHNNLGISETTNYGIENARGSLIALMDQDDISLPERLRKEVDFLENNQNIAAVSGNSITILENGELRERNPIYETPGLIRWGLLFSNQVQNPAAMVRKNIFQQFNLNYEEFSPSQDYRFWTQVCLTSQIANLNKPLLYHRVHDKNASLKLSHLHKEKTFKIRKDLISNSLGHQLSDQTISILLHHQSPNNAKDAEKAIKLLIDWYQWNKRIGLSHQENSFIREKTGKKIREIWRATPNGDLLFPYVVYSGFLEINRYFKIKPNSLPPL